MCDNAGSPFIISKYEIKKLNDKYTAISVADVMTENYNKKLELQRMLMKRQMMTDDQIRKELDMELEQILMRHKNKEEK